MNPSSVLRGPEIAPGEMFAERADYGQVVLNRLRQLLQKMQQLSREYAENAYSWW